jgi:hypothetical protein
MKKGKLTAEMIEQSAWTAALAAVSAPTDTVPPGWLTISELSKQTGSATATLQHKIRRLIDAGKAERKDFRIHLAKNVRPVPHYRLK